MQDSFERWQSITRCPHRSSTDKISELFRSISFFKSDISDSQSFSVSGTTKTHFLISFQNTVTIRLTDACTLNIWIQNRWIPDTGFPVFNCKVMWLGGPFEYWTFWTINRLFSVWFSNHFLNFRPFDNQTQIWHLNARLVRYSDGYCTFGGL